MFLINLIGRKPTTKSKDWQLLGNWNTKFTSSNCIIYFKIKITTYINYTLNEWFVLGITCYTSTGQIIGYAYTGNLRTKKEFQDYCKSQNLTYELIEDYN